MSYDLEEFIYSAATPERALLIHSTLDLLRDIEYYDHIDQLEDILSVAEDYDSSTNMMSIDEILQGHLLTIFSSKGIFYANEKELGISFLYKMLSALTLIEETEDKAFFVDQVLSGEESDDKDKLISCILAVKEMDKYELEDKIDTVSGEYIEAISTDETNYLEVPEKTDNLQEKRLQSCEWLNESFVVKDFMNSSATLGFPLKRVFLLLRDELLEITDDEWLSRNLITLVLASDAIGDLREIVHEMIEDLIPDIRRQARVGLLVDTFFEEFNHD